MAEERIEAGAAPVRRWLYRQMAPAAQNGVLSLLNRVLVAAILASVLLAVLETERTVTAGRNYGDSALNSA